ncbi:MAG: SsrA-binding protein SmpB [Alphaproteobacteria bacterium]
MAKKETRKNNLITNGTTIAQNRRAKFDYAIEETFEAGIVLTGSEVKSLREGKASIAEAYVAVNDEGHLQLINASIEDYSNAGYSHHAPRRLRELLMHKKEIARLWQATQAKGKTIVPMSIYFNKYGKVKVKIGLAMGKSKVDKRNVIKDRDWQRDKARIMREHNG